MLAVSRARALGLEVCKSTKHNQPWGVTYQGKVGRLLTAKPYHHPIVVKLLRPVSYFPAAANWQIILAAKEARPRAPVTLPNFALLVSIR